jgi:hypothetical protein
MKLIRALLGGHWLENTTNLHDPDFMGAISVLKNWVIGDDDRRPGGDKVDNDVKVTWVVLNVLSGWSIYRTTDGSYGIGPDACLPGDLLYAILGCKDPIMLRNTEDSRHRIIGPTYIYDFSCGQVLLKKALLPSSFINSFSHPDFSSEKADEPGKVWDLQNVSYPHENPDGHPLWYIEALGSSSDWADRRLGQDELKKRGIEVESIFLE